MFFTPSEMSTPTPMPRDSCHTQDIAPSVHLCLALPPFCLGPCLLGSIFRTLAGCELSDNGTRPGPSWLHPRDQATLNPPHKQVCPGKGSQGLWPVTTSLSKAASPHPIPSSAGSQWRGKEQKARWGRQMLCQQRRTEPESLARDVVRGTRRGNVRTRK